MTLIKCTELTLGYEKKQIAPPVSLEVREGDFIAITGENGAGKSTLVKTLLGLTPPISGKVSFEGGFSRRDIGYLPQTAFIPRDFPASVFEAVLSGCIGRTGSFPFFRKSHRALALENMRRLGIEDLARRSFCELSGGQAQRVLLCRALCAADKLLLLDEPVAGLDPSATHEMYDAVAQLNRRDKMAILMVSHDICTTLGYATHILHLGRDEIFFGTADEYRRSAVGHEFIFAHGGICDCDEHAPKQHDHDHTHDHDHSNGEVAQ